MFTWGSRVAECFPEEARWFKMFTWGSQVVRCLPEGARGFKMFLWGSRIAECLPEEARWFNVSWGSLVVHNIYLREPGGSMLTWGSQVVQCLPEGARWFNVYLREPGGSTPLVMGTICAMPLTSFIEHLYNRSLPSRPHILKIFPHSLRPSHTSIVAPNSYQYAWFINVLNWSLITRTWK